MTMLRSVGVRNAGNTVFLRCPRARTLCRPSTNSAMISQAFHSNMSVTHTQRDFGDNVFEQNVKTAETLNYYKSHLISRLACGESTSSPSDCAFDFFSGCRRWSPGLTATGRANILGDVKLY